MIKIFKSLADGWRQVFTGEGYVPPPMPGNMANAPADPAVVTGSYEFIIAQMFPSRAITDIPAIPPFGVDWGQYPLNGYNLSGLTGGGSTGLVPNVNQGAVLYFDTDSGNYYDLAMLPGYQAGV